MCACGVQAFREGRCGERDVRTKSTEEEDQSLGFGYSDSETIGLGGG